MKENQIHMTSFNELTIEDIARSQERQRRPKIEKRASVKAVTQVENHDSIKVVKIVVGAFAGVSIAVIGAAVAFSGGSQVASQSAIVPSAEIVKTEAPSKCDIIREELLSAANDVGTYYSNTVGGSSDEYYALRNKADALKQQALDANCTSFDPERIRY